MSDAVNWMVGITVAFLVCYYTIYNLGTLWITLVAARHIRRESKWPFGFEQIEVFSNPLTPIVSIIVPAHNEEVGIVSSVRSLQHLRYPAIEILVVDDGSTDQTFEALERTFSMTQAPDSTPDERVPQEGETLAEYVSADGTVRVLRKRSVGRRADAVNAALRVAQGELVCMIDADSMLAPDALLRMSSAFIDDPQVIAVGGTVLPSNGISFEGGNPTTRKLPSGWLERFQIIEYLRAFVLGRSGWARRNGLTVISGALGLYRKDLLMRVGGLTAKSLAEDADLLLAVNTYCVERNLPYRVVFEAAAVCWTEVPATLKQLGSQRTRWSHGLDEILRKYRYMMFNRNYGRLGMTAMPWMLAYEYLAPLLALAGVLISLCLFAFGAVGVWGLVVLMTSGLGLAAAVGVVALAVQVLWLRMFTSRRQILALFLMVVIEPVVFRPLTFYWQIRGIVRAWGRKEAAWGTMVRTGTGLNDDATVS